MKSWLGVFLLLSFIESHAQVVLVRDKQTKQGIAMAVVQAENETQPLFTNEQGEVFLNARNQQVKVSHVAYRTYIGSLQGQSPWVIELEAHVRQLNDVVVTGQFEPQSARKSVYQVRNISAERIQSRGATRLQDVLNSELNIRFDQDNALGGSNLSIQGLAGQNVKVMIDGLPMTGRQGTSNEININQIDINTIERIEIVEGPMSVMYGADALAGVINIITKKPGSERLQAFVRLHEESVGNEYGIVEGIHNQALGLTGTSKQWTLASGLSQNYFGGWQGDAPARDKAWHPKQQWLGYANVGFRNDWLHTWYRLDALNENIDNPGSFEGNQALDQAYITQRWMHQWQSNVSVSNKFQLNSAFSYTDYYRRTLSTTVDRTTGDRRLALGEGQQDRIDNDGFIGRITANYLWYSWLNTQAGIETTYEMGSGGRLKEGNQEIQEHAVFLSAEISPWSDVSIRSGARIVNNSVYQSPPLIPSLNIKWTFLENWDLRMAYGRGFRAPSIRELYFNYFDASHAIEGNPNLNAELSHSVNGSLQRHISKGEWQFSSNLGAFYNSVNNLITNGYLGDNTQITTYINIGEYKTQGVNWVNNLNLSNKLEWSVGISYVGRYTILEEAGQALEPWLWSPEINTNATWFWPNKGSSVHFAYKFTGITPFYQVVNNEVSLAETQSFHWADLSFRQEFVKTISLNTGIRNLMNVSTIDSGILATGAGHSGGAQKPIGYGRSFFLSIQYQFKK